MKPDDEERAHAAALAGLPAMTPVRLAKLLNGFHPVLALKAVQAGAHPADPDRRFAGAAGTTDVDEVWASYCRCGVRVLLPSEPGYPTMLLGDPGAPAVLFALRRPLCGGGCRQGGHCRNPVSHTLRPTGGFRVSFGFGDDGRRCRFGPGAWYRRGRPRRSIARVWGRVSSSCGCRRNGSRHRLSGRQPRTVGSGGITWGHLVRGGSGYEASSGRVPGPQSDHCRLVRRGRGGGEPPGWRFPVHR